MSRFEYQSIKLTNHVQRFVITTRPYGKNLMILAYIAHGPKILIAYNVSLCYT